jgi:hypothetical protein
MLKNKTEIIFIITGLAIAGAMFYFYQNKNKSFLDMSELEKKKFVEDIYKRNRKIANDPNLNQQQKKEAMERIGKINLIKFTDEERKEISNFQKMKRQQEYEKWQKIINESSLNEEQKTDAKNHLLLISRGYLTDEEMEVFAGFDLKKFMSIQIKPSQGDFNWGSVLV